LGEDVGRQRRLGMSSLGASRQPWHSSLADSSTEPLSVRIATLPGVFRPISDTWLLARAMREHALWPGAAVLDVCTGSGVLAICAAQAGASMVTAVDISRRAVLCARVNARLNDVSLTAHRSDLFSGIGDARYDLIVSNPPYVPDERDDIPRYGRQRAWRAGRDGRALLDRLVAEAPRHLRAGGTLMVVQSEFCGTDATQSAMAAGGLTAEVVARQRGPLGPLMRARRRHLGRHGLLRSGLDEEEVVVIAGRRGSAPRSLPPRPGHSRL
jgi:release factor glutamine methyltransferase